VTPGGRIFLQAIAKMSLPQGEGSCPYIATAACIDTIFDWLGAVFDAAVVPD